MRRFLSFIFKLTGFLTILAACSAVALLYFAGYWLPVEGQAEPADVIVVLGGSPSRALYAADLYHKEIAPAVIVSRTWRSKVDLELEKLGVDFCADEVLSSRILLAKDVPTWAIGYFGERNMSTAQEAIELQKLFAGDPVRLLIVTSPYHVRRTRLVMDRYMPCCEHQVVGSPYEPFAKDWWNDRDSARALVLESAKYIYFFLGGRFLAEPAAAPASETGKESQ